MVVRKHGVPSPRKLATSEGVARLALDFVRARARDGRAAYEGTLISGNHEIAELFAAHDAKRITLSLDQQAASACIGGCGDKARALLASHRRLRDDFGLNHRVDMVCRAVEDRRPEAVG